LHVASFRAIPESTDLYYTDNSARAVKCLAAQLIALGEISALQNSVSLVLPAYKAQRVNLSNNERNQLLEQVGRNIASAIAEAHKKNPAHRVRVLVTNIIPVAFAQSLPF